MNPRIVRISSFQEKPSCRLYHAEEFAFVLGQTDWAIFKQKPVDERRPDFTHSICYALFNQWLPVERVEIQEAWIRIWIKEEMVPDDKDPLAEDPWARIEGRLFFKTLLFLNSTPEERQSGHCWERPDKFELRVSRPGEEPSPVADEILALCDDLAKIQAGAMSDIHQHWLMEGLELARWHLERLVNLSQQPGAKPRLKAQVLWPEIEKIAKIASRLSSKFLDYIKQLELRLRINEIAHRNEALLAGHLDLLGKRSLSFHTLLPRKWPQ